MLLLAESYGGQHGGEQQSMDRNKLSAGPFTLLSLLLLPLTITVYTSFHRWVCLVRRRSSAPRLHSGLSRGRMVRRRKAASQRSYVVTDAYTVTTATHAERLVMSGHTNRWWSLVNNSVDSPVSGWKYTCFFTTHSRRQAAALWTEFLTYLPMYYACYWRIPLEGTPDKSDM